MKRSITLIAISFLISSFSYSQSDTIFPIMINKSVLSGVGLEQVEIKNEPEKQFFQKNIFRGNDLSVYVVSTESWNNTMHNFPFDEFIYMLNGEAEIRPEQGQPQTFYSGDYFFAHKGYTGEWEIKAGANYHYELSIIATQRADTTKIISSAEHQLFDREKLSGTNISFDDNGEHNEVLVEGAELTVTLHAEQPNTKQISQPSKELVVHILSGQLTYTQAGISKTYYTGDFVIIPKGYIGECKSEGHGLVKYLIVEKT